jgi:hypothetical protein
MDYRSLFELVRNRSGMYLPGRSYPEAAAFVLGLDAGNDWCLLHGFREWVVMACSEPASLSPTNLAWSAIVLRIAFPDAPELWNPGEALKFTSDQHDRAVQELFRLLGEFLSERDRPNGLAEIYRKYQAWLPVQVGTSG